MQIVPTIERFHGNVSRFANQSNTRFSFDVDVQADEFGLRLVRVGNNSPLRRLSTIERLLRGEVEVGDSIVAVNGVSAKNLGDLSAFNTSANWCEVSIFDYRTRQTVSWRIQLGEVPNALYEAAA